MKVNINWYLFQFTMPYYYWWYNSTCIKYWFSAAQTICEPWKSNFVKCRFFKFQLLLGLRDINDSLVSASLYAIGDLVPILGGETVIGGPQKAYFKEGKPKVIITFLLFVIWSFNEIVFILYICLFKFLVLKWISYFAVIDTF